MVVRDSYPLFTDAQIRASPRRANRSSTRSLTDRGASGVSMPRDPSGIVVDVVEQIEPDPGFWPRYLG